VVEVPAHDFVLVRPSLFLDCVVEDQTGVIPLDLAHNLFDLDPQVFRCVRLCGQVAGDFLWRTSPSSIADKTVDVANPLLQIR
jgi:hypothetical protein